MGRPAWIALLLLVALAAPSLPLLAQAPPPDEPASDTTVAAVGDAGPPDVPEGASLDADRSIDAGDSAAAADSGPHAEEHEDYEPLDETVAACVQAFRDAQKVRRQGALGEAHEQLLACLAPECPGILRDKCRQWIREVEDAMPSVVIEATDPAGRPTSAVRVTADGKLLVAELPKEPLPLDPGDHLLRFEHPGAPVQRKWLVLRPGEKGRRITLAFTRAPRSWYQPVEDAEPKPPEEPSIWSPLAVGSMSVAAVGLTVGAITGAVALDRLAEIESACPDDLCPPDLESDYDQAAALAHVSTGGFVVGGVAGAIGILALVEAAVHPAARGDDTTNRQASRPPIELSVSPAGALLWGRF